MIDLRELDETIEQLRHDGTTVSQAEKLALLYIARDHMLEDDAQNAPAIPAASYAAGPLTTVPDYPETASDFLRECAGHDVDAVLSIMDDHMQAIAVLYPKEYRKILLRLQGL